LRGELAVREQEDWRGRARELGAMMRSGRRDGRGMKATEGGSVVVMLLL
jgi:hypothetical protein